MNFRLSRRRDRVHRRPLRRRRALRRPGAQGHAGRARRTPQVPDRGGRRPLPPPAPSQRRGPSRTRARPRPSTTPRARPPGPRASSSPTGASGSTRPCSGCTPGVSDRDVYLHTLPMFHATAGACRSPSPASAARTWCSARSTAPRSCAGSSEHGVTLMCAAPAVVNAALERRRDLGGRVPGRDAARIIVAGAPPPTRTIERVETELGWEFIQIYGLTETSPLLTSTAPGPSGTTSTPRERAAQLGRAGAPALGVRGTVDPQGEVLARPTTILDGYWEQPEETARVHRGRLVPHRRRRLPRRGRLPGDLRPQEGRDHLRRRERLLDRGGGRAAVSTRRSARSR